MSLSMDSDKKQKKLIIPLIGMSTILLLFLLSLAYLSHLGNEMVAQHSPLVDASMEIKTNVVLHHLWLEELIQGDPTVNSKKVWAYLDASEWYAKAMIYGGKNHEGTFIPLDDPELNIQIKGVIQKIIQLRKLGKNRLNNPEYRRIGSATGQEFDTSFKLVMQQANHVESYLKKAIERQISWFNQISSALIFIFSIISVAVLIGYVFYERRRKFDLEKYQRLTEELNQAQKMDAVGTLVGGIAHDFNNMLAAITGNVYLAKKAASELPKVVNRLEKVEDVSLRAANMISQLLTFSRKGMVNIKEIPLNSFIKETLKFIRVSLPENIILHKLFCSEHLNIKGDTTQLYQVLINLINNARDAVENVKHPSITVRLETYQADETMIEHNPNFKIGSYAHISVEDNGYGIPEPQLEHIFEPFFTTKEQGKGTGLGLSMIFGALKTHHGVVTVDSTEGKGSTFHIYIPLLEQLKVAPFALSEGKTARNNGELILLADDEKDVRKTTAEVLESMGYKVLQAENGLEALKIYKTHQKSIALVLLDVVMPHMGGAKLAEKIRKMNVDVPIIFMTGYDKEHVLDINNPMAKSNILAKPVQVSILDRAIRQYLD